MLTIENLSYEYPQKNLYSNISFTIEDGLHAAFIGTNGTGKSTLVNIISNPDNYMYTGKIILDEGCEIGYVKQFYEQDKTVETTVFDYISEPFVALSNEINDICVKMESGENMDELMEFYQNTWDKFTAIDGDSFEINIKKQLKTAGLTDTANLKLYELSGGKFKLVQIIREMITYPGLLIMDEPDVFLDFENLRALRDLINTHKGTLLIITHNRYLLNHCFNKIIHLENTEIQEFEGNYRDYNFALLMKKLELKELAQKDQEEILRNKQLVDKLRNRATAVDSALRGKQLKAKVSQLKRLEARQIKAPFVEIPQPQINLHTDLTTEENANDTILTIENYHISFDEQLLENVSFEMSAHDKVAIVGSNGTGKTTLLRDIVEGRNSSVTIAPTVVFSYLSQIQGETLNEHYTVLKTMEELGFENESEVADFLQSYGFNEYMLNQKISALSGGERNLLQLAVISRSNSNLLLLDEPTSHLDTYAQVALEQAIANYNGAVLMVSHDFYTIANCADYVLFVADKTIRRMSGRKFRKLIYAKHFEPDYLEKDINRKEIEQKIAHAIKAGQFEDARKLAESLDYSE